MKLKHLSAVRRAGSWVRLARNFLAPSKRRQTTACSENPSSHSTTKIAAPSVKAARMFESISAGTIAPVELIARKVH